MVFFRRILLLALLASASASLVRADSPTVTAVLTSSETEVDQPVQLQIKVTGDANATPPNDISVDGLALASPVTLICNCTGPSTSVSELVRTAVTVGASARSNGVPAKRETPAGKFVEKSPFQSLSTLNHQLRYQSL